MVALVEEGLEDSLLAEGIFVSISLPFPREVSEDMRWFLTAIFSLSVPVLAAWSFRIAS